VPKDTRSFKFIGLAMLQIPLTMTYQHPCVSQCCCCLCCCCCCCHHHLCMQHMLPNFNECWWDSWVLDVLICNSLGERFWGGGTAVTAH
jgi:hypothetical protein